MIMFLLPTDKRHCAKHQYSERARSCRTNHGEVTPLANPYFLFRQPELLYIYYIYICMYVYTIYIYVCMYILYIYIYIYI